MSDRSMIISKSASADTDLGASIKRIDNNIKGRIIAREPRLHKHYQEFLQRNPVASLEIPNGIFQEWEKKISLQAASAGRKVSTYADLLNFSLAPSTLFALVNDTIVGRLSKVSARTRSTYTTLKGAKKMKFKKSFYTMLVFESEVIFHHQTSCSTLELRGSEYDKVKVRQKQRKVAEIKSKILQVLKGAESAGLQPLALTFKRKRGDTLAIDLGKERRTILYRNNTMEIKKALLYVLMKYNVPNDAYHQIASLFPVLPRIHQMINLKKEMEIVPVEQSSGSVEGSYCNFMELLSQTITRMNPTNSKVRVKLSLDGAKYSRDSNFCILSFAVLCTGEEFRQSNVHVLSVLKADETYDNIAQGMQTPLKQINDLIKAPNVSINGKTYEIEIFLCADYKMILILMGLKKATAQFACVWCKVDQKDRWDVSVPDEEYITHKKRTLATIYKDCTDKKYSCERLPLLNIETDHILPDELHLLLRITDVLLQNLIATAVANDKHTMNTRWKVLQGPMLNAVITNIRRCGIPFHVWTPKDESSGTKSSYSFTSLVGYQRKKLLKFFPSKILLCQPPEKAKDVQKLWEDFRDIYYIVSARNPFNPLMDYEELQKTVKAWITSYTNLKTLHMNYRPKYVTPYMHILSYHVGFFINKYGNIKQFSCQAVEKKNDVCKSIFFRSTDKWNPTEDIIKYQQRLSKLAAYERRKRTYTQRKASWWRHGGIIANRAEHRAKRRKTD